MKTNPNRTETAKLVHFGRGGDTVHFANGHTISGYGSPESPHAAVSRPDRMIPDGCPAVDVRPALETPEGFSWVFNGPLVNVDLPAGAIDKLGDIDPLFADALMDGFGLPVALHLARNKKAVRPLDAVSIPEYLAGWKERGARVGYYENQQIVWIS